MSVLNRQDLSLLPVLNSSQVNVFIYLDRTPGFNSQGRVKPRTFKLVVMFITPDSSVLDKRTGGSCEVGGAEPS